MYNILTLNKISKTGLSVLPADVFAISDACDTPDGIILRSFSMHEYEMPASLKAVARAGAGVNNIPIDKCSDAGIVVFNTPGANANAVKELIICGMLMSSRRVVDGIKWVDTLEGQTDVAKTVEKGKADFVGPEIMGKTLGIVGLGAIGRPLANAAVALGMTVVGFDNYITEEGKKQLHESVQIVKTLDELLAVADYISLNVPATAETKGMVNATNIAKMKDGVRILNFARGDLAINADVKAGIESGKIAFYVTDLPTEDIVKVKNIITVPHLGASTPESEENCAFMAAEQMKAFLVDGNIRNSVNFPNLTVPRTTAHRVCVMSKGNENIGADLEAVCKDAKVVASVRGNLGYAIIDAEGEICLKCIGEVAGVVKVVVIA